MEASIENNEKIFESVLRGLSVNAFNLIISHGIRDLETFLHMNPAAIEDTSPDVVVELKLAQEMVRQHLKTETVCDELSENDLMSDSDEPNCESEPTLTVDNPETPFDESEYDRKLFQVVLDSLDTRARNILLYNSVRETGRFLKLTEDEIVGFRNAGVKTVADILEIQQKLRNLISSLYDLQTFDENEVRLYLARPLPKFKLSRHIPLFPWNGQPRGIQWRFVEAHAEKSIDTPAPWSILRGTILDLFQIDPGMRATVWNAASNTTLLTLDISSDEWGKLNSAAIYEEDYFDTLLALNIDYLVGLRINDRSFDSILDSVRLLCEQCIGFIPDLNMNASAESIILDSEIAAICKFRVDSFDVPDELMEEMHKLGVVIWSDLTAIAEKRILASLGDIRLEIFGQIRQVWRMKLYVQQANYRVSGLASECYTSFDSMIEAFIDMAAKTPRDKTILLGRMGLLEGRKWTLDDLGNLLSLTRERVRQVEHRRLHALVSTNKIAKLARFWLAVDEILRITGGTCLIDEMAEQLASKLEWNHKPGEIALSTILRLSENIIVDKETGFVSDPQNRCLGCAAIISALGNLFAEDKSERPLLDVIQYLLATCDQNNECNKNSQSLSEGFVRFVATKTENILFDEGVVYCRETWGSRRGSRMQLVEGILRDAGCPLHFSEVYQEVRRLLPDDKSITEHNVHSWLGGTNSILLWDRGTFVHRECVIIPSNLIEDVESWLVEKLSNGIPFVSVAGAFAEFENRCRESGITSESALYTCLRRSDNPDLHCPRYPQVYLACAFESRIPAAVALEQFIEDAGGKVSDRALRAYALGELYLKEFQFQYCMPQLSITVSTTRVKHVHTEFLNVDRKKFAAVMSYALYLLRNEEHVSIAKIFSDKCITCTVMGIDSPEMLYSALKIYTTDELDLSHYPIVRLADQELSETKNRGVIAEVVGYIQEKNAPCSFDELEAIFVEKLGYSDSNVYASANSENVLRFGRGTIVHIDTLEWTNDRQHQLELQAQAALYKARASGRCYALASRLLENHELPRLGNSLVWTQTLLAGLLERGRKSRVLGNARNAFVSIPNDEGIKTFEDLMCNILRYQYEGASNLDSFEEDMREAGIIQKKITPSMLGDQEKVCIIGHLILLKELCDRA